MAHPWVRVAAMVVSEIKERLSPKKAPPTTIPTMKARFMSVFSAMPTTTGTNATIVPTEVPIEMDIKQAAKKTPANKRLSGNKWSVILTVASMAPMSFALWAKAPARIKIHIINMMFLLAAPMEYCNIRSFRLSPLVMQMAYTEEIMNATVMGTL